MFHRWIRIGERIKHIFNRPTKSHRTYAAYVNECKIERK